MVGLTYGCRTHRCRGLTCKFYKKCLVIEKFLSRAGEMVQWARVAAAKPDDLDLIQETHTVEGENELPQVVL